MTLLCVLEDSRPGYEVMYESLARVFVVKLFQSYGNELSAARDFGAGFTAGHYRRVLDYLPANYGNAISVEEIARLAEMGAAHFSRLFKEIIWETPHQYLTSFRIERLREMLSIPDRPMIDIALACGFADQPHFSRTLLRVAGQTPNAYRKSLQKSAS